jgi:hypothetical protein
MVKSDSGPFYREAARVSLLKEHLVLCHENWASRVAGFLQKYASPGFARLDASQLTGIPEGWTLFRDVVVTATPNEASDQLAVLVPIAGGASIQLSGGLRLGTGIWHTEAPPSASAAVEDGAFNLAIEREGLDDEAERRFLVRDRADEPAVECSIVDGDAPAPAAGQPPIHPDYPDRGTRTVPAGRVYLESSDLPPVGERVWLKGYGCVRRDEDELVFVDADIEVVREGDVDVVHWVPVTESLETCLRTLEGDITGYAEPGIADTPVDTVVQFERVGFARLDAFNGDSTDGGDTTDGTDSTDVANGVAAGADLVAYYAHP